MWFSCCMDGDKTVCAQLNHALQTFHQQNEPNVGGEIFSTIVWITHTLNLTKPANQSRQLANIITQTSGTQLIFTFCDAIMSISLYSHVEICFILLISLEKNFH